MKMNSMIMDQLVSEIKDDLYLDMVNNNSKQSDAIYYSIIQYVESLQGKEEISDTDMLTAYIILINMDDLFDTFSDVHSIKMSMSDTKEEGINGLVGYYCNVYLNNIQYTGYIKVITHLIYMRYNVECILRDFIEYEEIPSTTLLQYVRFNNSIDRIIYDVANNISISDTLEILSEIPIEDVSFDNIDKLDSYIFRMNQSILNHKVKPY